MLLSCVLEQFNSIAQRFVNQTRRRVIYGESVTAGEKIVSSFESHEDNTAKYRRDNFYGYKVGLTGGASDLIIDCCINSGNPADVDYD